LTPDPSTNHPPSPSGVYRYHLLRAAGDRFKCDLANLSEGQMREVERQAGRTLEIEDLVLASGEVRQVVIPPERVEAAVAELQGRYPDPDTFRADLERNGLDPELLSAALCRELMFDAVMQRVAARHAQVDEIDERLFYELHRERFTEPERRTARHILITVNDDFDENRREAVLARIEHLADKMTGRPAAVEKRFSTLARKHSECPTALDGGRLGEVGRGQLYPELDAVLFRLMEGQVGGPVETELGFHLVYCERIQQARTLPFSKVRETIHNLLVDRRRRNCQKAWLGELRQRRSNESATQEAQ
jgi:peptidyl-prolyl cis-trans isomerase C